MWRIRQKERNKNDIDWFGNEYYRGSYSGDSNAKNMIKLFVRFVNSITKFFFFSWHFTFLSFFFGSELSESWSCSCIFPTKYVAKTCAISSRPYNCLVWDPQTKSGGQSNGSETPRRVFLLYINTLLVFMYTVETYCLRYNKRFRVVFKKKKKPISIHRNSSYPNAALNRIP